MTGKNQTGKKQNPAVVCALALLCCALWGSAFPCIKLGYAWLDIEGTEARYCSRDIGFSCRGYLLL